MNKTDELFLAIIIVLAALAGYEALFPPPASTALIRFLALGGFFLVCAALSIGPLAVLSPKTFAAMMEPRRAVGIASFAFVLLHFLLVLSV